MAFDLPLPVEQALRALNAAGYEAYAVGGCVRDLLRGVPPHDYDVCTAALPEQTRACFPARRVLDTGVKHGTVTVLLDGMPLEITTFRADGDYLDGRHPQSVSFTRSLHEDLARRDFTVNAMAYHPDTGVIDPFGGQGDLARGLIRCVGEAAARLTEDALRILRALRFSAQLGFSIDEDTARAMRSLRGRLSLVSRERVAAELLQTVRAPGAAEALAAFPEVFFAALPAYPPEAFAEGLSALRALPPGDAALRLAALLSPCPQSAGEALASLRLSKALHGQTMALVAEVRVPFPSEDAAVRLAALGEAQLARLLALQQATGVLTAEAAQARADRMREALRAGLPMLVRGLPVRGEDLLALGLRGEEIGEALSRLHRLVLRGGLPCEREALLEWIRKNKA